MHNLQKLCQPETFQITKIPGCTTKLQYTTHIENYFLQVQPFSYVLFYRTWPEWRSWWLEQVVYQIHGTDANQKQLYLALMMLEYAT